ncbi:uncharacterized protein A4U43_C04F15700 [Asparagus officinalis]|uniref:Uncharacterized protein n=1 Tax=Asparagus officinalis TaxID=4686 RepID=A0A5P1F5V1_ASPOF|nr:uncharacterized protein A4U43_C04F15700 [Asparagus officinalis]
MAEALIVELVGDIGLRDPGVMMEELVSGEAERADPDLGVEIDAAVRVEDDRARGLASERGVGEGDEIGTGSDRMSV